MKLDVKTAIDAVAPLAEPVKRLRFILQHVALLSDELTPATQVRRFVFIVSALVHHQRFGGLSPRQCSDLIDYGFAILQLSGIKPRTSPSSSLYAELCVISSQVYRLNGRFWEAAWEHGMAAYMAPEAPPAGVGFLALGLGDRTLRLGNLALAANYYECAEKDRPPKQRLEKARIGRLRTLRLAGKKREAEALAATTLETLELSPGAAREVEWEALCATLGDTQDLKPLLNATNRNGSHYAASYVIEAWLWAHAVASDGWRKRVVTIRYLARKKSGIKPQTLGLIYDLALALEHCYDPEAPLGKSLQDLGKLLADTHRIASLDHELLVWAAAARWLARIGSLTQAALALGRYKVLSLMLSNGALPDVLDCVSDLLAAPWANGLDLANEGYDVSA